MRITSFVTYLKGIHPTISIGSLDTASGETTTRTLGLSEYWIEDGNVVYADSGKDRSPSYPADRYLKNADYLVRYTDDLLFSWLKGERILFETQQRISEFRKFVGLEIGDHIPTVAFDDDAVEQELDISLGFGKGIRERYESLSDHITDVGSDWEKGLLSLNILAFSHINRKALSEESAEKSKAEKQRDKEAERKAQAEAVHQAVKAKQSKETKKRLDEI